MELEDNNYYLNDNHSDFLPFYSSESDVEDHPVKAEINQEARPLDVDTPTRRGRKRNREPQKHQRISARRDRNAGKEYTNRLGIKVGAKKFTDFICGCCKMCNTLVEENERKTMFTSFWAMGNFSSQNAFLCGLVKKVGIKQRRPRNHSRASKGATYQYYVNTPTESIKVCKKYFLQSFGISDGRLSRALNKVKAGTSPGEDKRGKKPNPPKIPEDNSRKAEIIQDVGPLHVNPLTHGDTKRLQDPEKHQRISSQRDRNAGKEYTNRSGIKVGAKKFTDFVCGCCKMCNTLVEENERKTMFTSFWAMGNFSSQNAFLCGLVAKVGIKQRRPRNHSRASKDATYGYYVNTPMESVKVCKKYFLQSFGISNGRLSRALNKIKAGASPGEDKRGKKPNPRKIPEDRLEIIRAHIRSFPTYESHSTRVHNPERKYLSPELDVRQMYRRYVQKCSADQVDPVTESIYGKTFRKDFSLHFHSLRKDKCK